MQSYQKQTLISQQPFVQPYARLSEIADELDIARHDDDDLLPRLCGLKSRQLQTEGLAHDDLYETVVRGSRTPVQPQKRRRM